MTSDSRTNSFLTTFDWQHYKGNLCVMGIGSFEQHSSHLPLNTDFLLADYFARILAVELDAVLLPTLPFGNSFEQSGFRGTVSLKPETLMQIVRDIANELEQQNLTRLIIVNGHGGNFAIMPVIRDINRVNRALKICCVNFWEYCDADLSPDLNSDIHAGQWETSLMLAAYENLVLRDKIVDGPEKLSISPSILNSFGIGYFSPTGTIGMPSKASKEKGTRIIESVRRNMPSHVRDWLEKISANSRYSGQGGIAIRQLGLDDLTGAMKLVSIAGWNQVEADWKLFLESNPAGCFAAVHNGHLAGTSTVIKYQKELAWIGMVLVSPEFRRMGIATTLLNKSIESAGDVRVIKLDATAQGRDLYRKLGFEDEYIIHRLAAKNVAKCPLSPNVQPITEMDLKAISELDRKVFDACRSPILNWLFKNDRNRAFKIIDSNNLRGYSFGRAGNNSYQLGPVVATDTQSAIELLGHQLSTLIGNPMLIDVPESQKDIISCLENIGFVRQRSFIRMSKGCKIQPVVCDNIFAIAGPELG